MRIQSWLRYGGASLAVVLLSGCFGFTAEPMEGQAPLEVQFRDNSVFYGEISRLWNFGDRHVPMGENTSTAVAPRHTYQEPGRYRATLRLEVLNGLHTATLVKYIEVEPAPEPPGEEGEGEENGNGDEDGDGGEEGGED